MRLYKVINSEKFKDAKEFLELIYKQKKENLDFIRENITPFDWQMYSGWSGGFYMLETFNGFIPKPKLDKIPSGWKFDKDNEELLVPNKRTKLGKKIYEDLNNLQNWSFHKIFDVLNIHVETIGRFTIPGLYLSKDEKEVYLKVDFKVELDEKDFEEVTVTYVNKMLGIK